MTLLVNLQWPPSFLLDTCVSSSTREAWAQVSLSLPIQFFFSEATQEVASFTRPQVLKPWHNNSNKVTPLLISTQQCFFCFFLTLSAIFFIAQCRQQQLHNFKLFFSAQLQKVPDDRVRGTWQNVVVVGSASSQINKYHNLLLYLDSVLQIACKTHRDYVCKYVCKENKSHHSNNKSCVLHKTLCLDR